jgi:8-oxo-dGTP pyrophosphatase MutT (NUDIX family)
MDDDDFRAHEPNLTAPAPEGQRTTSPRSRLARAPAARQTGTMTLVERLARHLRERERETIVQRGAVECAVLIPFVRLDEDRLLRNEFDVVYTLRSEHLPNHKGQVAFPGGKKTGREESLETALREAQEEVGIEPRDVEIVGCLDDVSTMAGQYIITPWVGVLPSAYPFRPNPHEVADVFSIRLSALADPRHHARTARQWGGNSYDLPAITAGRHEIWGATHQITMNLLDLLDEAQQLAIA